MSDRKGAERRAAGRNEILLKVEYQAPNNLVADYLTDLSNGGLFIRTEAPFALGQELDFTLSFPGLLDPLRLQGVVRWQRPPGGAEQPGVGVEFLFPDEAARQAVARFVEKLEPAQPPTAAAQRPFRVLVVEDNEFVHDLFQHALQKFHRGLGDPSVLQVLPAYNGQEALSLVGDEPPDMAVVDHFLPVMDGTELIRRLRANPTTRGMPILMVSTGGEPVRLEAMAAGADLYLDKPVLLKQLLHTLQALLAIGRR